MCTCREPRRDDQGEHPPTSLVLPASLLSFSYSIWPSCSYLGAVPHLTSPHLTSPHLFAIRPCHRARAWRQPYGEREPLSNHRALCIITKKRTAHQGHRRGCEQPGAIFQQRLMAGCVVSAGLCAEHADESGVYPSC